MRGILIVFLLFVVAVLHAEESLISRVSKIEDFLYGQQILSVLVEGGASIFSQFLESHEFDELTMIYAPKVLGKGLSAFGGILGTIKRKLDVELIDTIFLEQDVAIIYRNKETVRSLYNRDHVGI